MKQRMKVWSSESRSSLQLAYNRMGSKTCCLVPKRWVLVEVRSSVWDRYGQQHQCAALGQGWSWLSPIFSASLPFSPPHTGSIYKSTLINDRKNEAKIINMVWKPNLPPVGIQKGHFSTQRIFPTYPSPKHVPEAIQHMQNKLHLYWCVMACNFPLSNHPDCLPC